MAKDVADPDGPHHLPYGEQERCAVEGRRIDGSGQRVTLEFTAGSRSIKAVEALSLAEILLANRLPPSLFHAYEVRDENDLVPIPITKSLTEIPTEHNVVLRCIRNTDIDTLRSPDTYLVRRDSAPVAGLLDIEYGRQRPLSRVHLVDDSTLREIVCNQIVTFLQQHKITTPIVAGISGGGDSNTLVYGLSKFIQESSLPASRIVCFTLAMEPLWPESAVDRARHLCHRAGFEHRVLYACDMMGLLRMSMSPAKLWEAFRRDYGPDTVTSSARSLSTWWAVTCAVSCLRPTCASGTTAKTSSPSCCFVS